MTELYFGVNCLFKTITVHSTYTVFYTVFATDQLFNLGVGNFHIPIVAKYLFLVLPQVK